MAAPARPSSDPRLAAPLEGLVQTPEFDACRKGHAARGYATLAEIVALAAIGQRGAGRILDRARQMNGLVNGGATARSAIIRDARAGNDAAANLWAWAEGRGLAQHVRPMQRPAAQALQARLEADPAAFMADGEGPYPLIDETGRSWGFDLAWVSARLAVGQQRLAAFIADRRGDVAILAGNGPSLRGVDPASLRGADVFVSNYAIRDPGWRAVARGVAVTNRLVAAQDPLLFGTSPLWRFHPVWLGHELADSDRTVWLNAIGGPLFFSPGLDRHVAWHATVTFFWLQVLFHAGYRRVAMIGFDHSYTQPPVPEGAVLRQHGDDPNHFAPDYFRGRLWQAADTAHMGRTYALARQVFAAAGRDLVNATEGGALEVLPRRPLAEVLRK